MSMLVNSVVNPRSPGRRTRAGFGSLNADLIMRGVVPAQVIYGAHRPPPDSYESAMERSGNLTAGSRMTPDSTLSLARSFSGSEGPA